MVKESYEIKIADKIEATLKKDIYPENRFIIRRDGRALLPKSREGERHDIQLFTDSGPNATARNMANVDALVLDTKTKKVEMIIEYELDTNPKNLTGNFITPFLVNYYESKFHEDSITIYKLDPNVTLVYLIVCLPGKRSLSARDQSPLSKGEILKKRLLKIKNTIKDDSLIFDGDIIIGDELNKVEIDTKKSVARIKNIEFLR